MAHAYRVCMVYNHVYSMLFVQGNSIAIPWTMHPGGQLYSPGGQSVL